MDQNRTPPPLPADPAATSPAAGGKSPTRRSTWSDGAVAVVVVLALLGVYLLTLRPGPGGSGDAAKMQLLGHVLGTPHAPGYPTYLVLSALFSRLTPFFSPAVAANLLSAIMASLACGALFLAQRVLAVDRLPALAASLCFGLTPTLWSQAVMAEVYTLHVLFLALTLLLLLRWGRSQRGRDLLAAIAVYAFSFGNHVTMLFLAPAIALYLWLCDRSLLRRPRLLLVLLGLGMLAAAQYGYLVWRTYDPEVLCLETTATHLPELLDVMLGGQHRSNLFRLSAAELFGQRLPGIAGALLDEYHLLLTLVVLGLGRRLVRDDALLLTGAAGFLVFVASYTVPDLWVYLLPVLLMLTLYLGRGLQRLLRWLRLQGRGVWLVLLLPLLLGVTGSSGVRRYRNMADVDQATALLDAAPPRCGIISFQYHQAMLLEYLTRLGPERWRGQLILPAAPEEALVSFGFEEVRRYLCDGQRFRLPPRGELVAEDLPLLLTGVPGQLYGAMQRKGFELEPVAPNLVRLGAGDCREPRLPVAVIVHHLETCADDKAVIAAVARPDFNPRFQAVSIGRHVGVEHHPTRVPEPIRLLQWQDRLAEIDLDVAAPGWLVVTDRLPSFWRAWVDGAGAASVAVNIVHRAIPLQSGRHRVVLADAGRSFRLWRWITGAIPPLSEVEPGCWGRL